MKLYELQEAFHNIEALIENAEPEDDLTHLTQAMEIIEASIEDKVQAYAFVIKNFDSDIQAVEQEEKRLKKKREHLKRKHEAIKNALHQFMLDTEKTKFSFPQFTVSLRNNPESVQVMDETKIPTEYFVTKAPELSKSKLKDALQQGLEIEGASLVRKQSLQIR